MVHTSPPSPSGSVRSVERTLDLLIALEKADQPMGLSDLARATLIPKATAQRLLAVLERRGFVQKERWGYQLGTEVVPLAGAFLTGNSLARAAMPVLEELTMLSEETVSLQVRQGFDRVVVQRVHSRHSLGYLLQIGQRLPLYMGASGRVLMAAMPQEEFDLFRRQLAEVRLADGRLLTGEELVAGVEQVRQNGLAISWGEREVGVVSIAAPVARRGKSAIAALALTAPSNRMSDEKMEQLAMEIRQGGYEIARLYSRI